ncbi:M23 family metallopeptidase [bacterium]|nr:M23 family metallopeptidase [bacterium]
MERSPSFIWPLKGTITRGFKNEGPIHHSGIDISSPIGTPIVSTASGRVIYDGDKMSGYGNMIIIKHNEEFSSVYAHNRVNLVKAGERVEKGQIIAEVGVSGRSTGAHLHFEIRKNKKPVDPLLYLPNL